MREQLLRSVAFRPERLCQDGKLIRKEDIYIRVNECLIKAYVCLFVCSGGKMISIGSCLSNAQCAKYSSCPCIESNSTAERDNESRRRMRQLNELEEVGPGPLTSDAT